MALTEIPKELSSTPGIVDNSTSTAITIDSSNNINIPDNGKAIFGAGSDLQIYSDGTTGQVTGNVNVTGSVTTTGNVGIGTGSPFFTAAGRTSLSVNGTSSSILAFGKGGSSENYILADAGGLTIGNTSATLPTAFFNNGSTRMTIDASGNVGIGVVPENSSGTWRNLQFGGGNLAFRAAGANDAMVGTGYLFKSDNSEVYKNTEAVSRLFFDNSTMIFQQAASGTAGTAITWTNAMTLDASGNLLVGTTDSTPYNNSGAGNGGAGIQADGLISAARQDFPPAIFNRLVSDGDIVEFRKDGTTLVGSIASKDGDMTIGTGDTGIRFYDGGNSIYPVNASTQAGLDATIDLGRVDGSGTFRFKDLRLSGGVVFGDAGGSGTSSSNTFDSYEEGTFTPITLGSTSAGTGTYGFRHGSYTKVGNLVTVNIYVDTTSHTGIGSLRVGGLPFTVKAGSDQYAAVSIGELAFVTKDADTTVSGYTLPTTTTISINQTTTGTTEATTSVLPMDGLARLLLTVTYQT